MSMLIRMDDVPPADRLDFVREISAATWVPMECASEHQADYQGEFRVSGLGAMQVVVLDIMPIGLPPSEYRRCALVVKSPAR